MSLTREELVDMVFVLGECNRNALLASRVYSQHYPNRKHPDRRTFLSLLDRFTNTGSVKCTKRNRNNAILTDENQLQILLAVQENAGSSVREISRTIDISKSSVHRTLRKHKYHPYKIQLHQEITAGDFESRLLFCQWAIERIDHDANFFEQVIFSDESTFHKNGFVNRHNCHYYDTQNPHRFIAAHSQYRWSVNVWAGIIGTHIIGPFFHNQRLTGRVYLEFLQNNFNDLLENIPLAIRQRMWFQHDGAPPHYTAEVRQFLNASFPNRWIGRGGPVTWPPRSPDLTSCDFFLWGFIKNKVYKMPPTTPDDMRHRILRAFQEVTPIMLRNVQNCFQRRLQLCSAQNGQHFEHLM